MTSIIVTHEHVSKLYKHASQCIKYPFRCRRKEYGLVKLSEHEVPVAKAEGLTIMAFLMLGTNYNERRQFLIYGLTNFIADFGGYLGLLLGCSLLTFYDLGKECIFRFSNYINIRDRKTKDSAFRGRSYNYSVE